MNAATIAFPELALNADGDVLILDLDQAVEQFILEPISWELDLPTDEIADVYDGDILFSNIAVYGSINGREGFRLRSELTEERYWQLVESARI